MQADWKHGLVALIAASFCVLALPVAAQTPSQTLTTPGLHQPVEIVRDRWGVAHIYAKDEHDLFFAQGYNVASDRLFQLEIWRRQATGTVVVALDADTQFNATSATGCSAIAAT